MFERVINLAKRIGVGVALAAGLAYSGCQPQNTVPLPDDIREEIGDLIEDGEVETIGVKGLLSQADPLFDHNGDDVEDNSELFAHLDTLGHNLSYYFDNGQIVGYYAEDRPEDRLNPAFFMNYRTPNNLSDDYICINLDLYDNEIFGTDEMYHEGEHPYYQKNTSTGHPKAINDYLDTLREQYDFLKLVYYESSAIVQLTVEEKDSCFLWDILYGFMHVVNDDLERTLSHFKEDREEDLADYDPRGPCIETGYSGMSDSWALNLYPQAFSKLGITWEEMPAALEEYHTESYRIVLEDLDPEHEVFCWEELE